MKMSGRLSISSITQSVGAFFKRLFAKDDSVCGATLLPIRLTMLYLLLSVAVFAFGPFDWPLTRPVMLYVLLASYMIALWFGYRIGVKKELAKAIEWNIIDTNRFMIILSALIVVNYIIYIVNIFRDYGFQTLDFPELFRQMAVGIKNPGLGYRNRLVRIESIQAADIIGGRWMTLFNYMWAFVRYPILILGILKFKKLKVWGKIAVVLYLSTMALFYLSIGTSIDVLHVFLLLELPIVLQTFRIWYKRDLKAKHVLKLCVSFLLGIALVLSYFTWMMLSRGGINNYEQPDYNVGGVHLSEGVITTEDDAPYEEVPQAENPQEGNLQDDSQSESVSDRISSLAMKFWISFSSYFSQGYYGMSQALEVPWTPMFGVGNSMFLVDFISEHVYDIEQFTYQLKVEEAFGWDSKIQWNCMYTWLANDVSFFGVIIVMLLIGILFGAMFKDAIVTENPFAQMSVFYFILMMLFIPCNNQIAQRADTLFSFVLIVCCWLLSKHPPKILKKHFT